MRPIDLKRIATRFTEIFYPQWLSRVNRLWDMFEEVDFNQFAPATPNSEYHFDGYFGITGGTDPKFKECISGIAILAFTYHGAKDEDSISSDEIKKNISIVPNLKVTPALQKKLEIVLEEMLPLMVVGDGEKRNTYFNECDGEEYYFVYVSRESGFGTKRFLVCEDDLHTRYLSKKEDYDIIIYKLNVDIKTEIKDGVYKCEFVSLDLYSNLLTLLILFLKYKDEPLPFLKLYHCAWKDSVYYIEEANNSKEIMDNLKTGVSSLRKSLKPLKKFFVPPAKRNTEVYVCKGEFKFCLILSQSMDQMYTLELE